MADTNSGPSNAMHRVADTISPVSSLPGSTKRLVKGLCHMYKKRQSTYSIHTVSPSTR